MQVLVSLSASLTVGSWASSKDLELKILLNSEACWFNWLTATVKFSMPSKASLLSAAWKLRNKRNYWNRSRLCIILHSDFPRLLIQVDLYLEVESYFLMNKRHLTQSSFKPILVLIHWFKYWMNVSIMFWCTHACLKQLQGSIIWKYVL